MTWMWTEITNLADLEVRTIRMPHFESIDWYRMKS